MEFRDLKKQYQILKKEIDNAVIDVISNANYISGIQVKELEEELAKYVGVKHCITCANGTDALSLALMAWGVGKGDVIFVPDFTFFASGEVVSYAGAVPVFVDVLKDSYNIDPDKLEEAVQKVKNEGRLNPKAVIAVDLFGLPADYGRIKEICSKYNLMLLEDGAQGFGGTLHGKKACSFGNISVTSFFPAKPLGCYGDGGAVFTDNDKWAEIIRSYAVHGKGNSKYDNVRIGINSRLDTLQAAVLLVKFNAFKKYELENINKVAIWYNKMLKDNCIELPEIKEGFYSSFAQYTIKLPEGTERQKLQKFLNDLGIPSMVYYSKPLHLQKAFTGTESAKAYCPVTENLCRRVLSLPIDPY
ncbi:MAG: DegT/DnrJ/EryC1/StrS aminotransferase family protein, partial [Lachnospiraceae bacterium]|nr:DegT/DnrJ/EryC1/StrS aminotransferase family protein [Lachnospiraceae bacterium]